MRESEGERERIKNVCDSHSKCIYYKNVINLIVYIHDFREIERGCERERDRERYGERQTDRNREKQNKRENDLKLVRIKIIFIFLG